MSSQRTVSARQSRLASSGRRRARRGVGRTGARGAGSLADNHAMQDGTALREFYEEAYSHRPAASARYGEWRALGARGKADHIVSLCARAGVVPARTLEVGCGDGALLSDLG